MQKRTPLFQLSLRTTVMTVTLHLLARSDLCVTLNTPLPQTRLVFRVSDGAHHA